MNAAAGNEISVAVLGISGRMGGAVTALLAAEKGLRLTGGWCHGEADANSQALAGSITISRDLDAALRDATVAIDFTLPAATREVAAACIKAGCALVSGTTGLGPAEAGALDEAARSIPLLHATNMSAGVHLVAHLVSEAAGALDEREWDAQIMDVHHRHKRDAPSGTALTLGEAIASARGHALADVTYGLGDDRQTKRRQGGIGFSALRGGDVVGEHTVSFLADFETVEIRHQATDRRVFAAGALRAARWLAGREAGRYTMGQVLGLAAGG